MISLTYEQILYRSLIDPFGDEYYDTIKLASNLNSGDLTSLTQENLLYCSLINFFVDPITLL